MTISRRGWGDFKRSGRPKWFSMQTGMKKFQTKIICRMCFELKYSPDRKPMVYLRWRQEGKKKVAKVWKGLRLITPKLLKSSLIRENFLFRSSPIHFNSLNWCSPQSTADTQASTALKCLPFLFNGKSWTSGWFNSKHQWSIGWKPFELFGMKKSC